MATPALRTEPEDPHEEEMTSDTAVIHRDKGVDPGGARLSNVLALVVLGLGIGGVTLGPLPAVILPVPVLLAAVLAVSGMVRSIVRTAVTPTELRTRAGPRERRLPLSTLVRWEAVPEGSEPASRVRLTWQDRGREQSLVVASRDPEALLHAITVAREGAGLPPGG